MSQVHNNKIALLTIVPDYKDGNEIISTSGTKDAELIQTTFEALATAADMEVDLTRLVGDNITDQSISEWIAKVKQDSPRVAVVAYSGHGDKAPNAKWPRLVLRTTSDETTSGKDIRVQLKQSGIPLVITMYNACNISDKDYSKFTQKLLQDARTSPKRAKKVIKQAHAADKLIKDLLIKSRNKLNHLSEESYKKGARALLRQATGSVGYTSSMRGEMSRDSSKGSLGTALFAASLLRGCHEAESATWEKVRDSVQTYAKKSERQTPVCIVQET